MAKQPTLTVNVNQQQFQQFTRNFNAFSNQIKGLNTQFAQINTQLQKTNIAARAATATMNTLLNATKAVGTQVASITGHFLKWSTIIGGITALLGMGGGLFGIERLAASILAKRRLVLGLGGDYGRTQASLIYSQSLLQNPQSVLQNVRMGMGGSKDQMTALMSLGIPFGTKQSPEEVMDQVLERASKIMRNAPKGTELMVAQAYGLDKLMDPMDLLRLSTEEGRKELELRRQLIEKYKDQLKVTPRAAAAWSELSMQLHAAGAQVESLFGEKLADLAKPLKDLSDGFVHLIQVLMQNETVRNLIKKLGEGIEWLAEKLKNLTQKELEEFIEEIRKTLPSMKDFKSYMKEFAEIMEKVVTVLRFIKDYVPGSQAAAAQATGAGGVHGWLQKNVPWASDQAIKDLIFGKPSTAAPANAPANAPTAAPANAAAPAAMSPGGGGGFQFPGIGGLPGKGASFPGGMPSWLFGGMNQAGIGGGASAWSGAANKMAPDSSFGGRFGNWSGSSDTPQKGGSRPGPLSMNNWQMNRTANLVVRNVPGANVFMSAAGMSG
jgi:hypothetical protein